MSSPAVMVSKTSLLRTLNKNYTKKNTFSNSQESDYFHIASTDEESQSPSIPASGGYSSGEDENDSKLPSENSSPLLEHKFSKSKSKETIENSPLEIKQTTPGSPCVDQNLKSTDLNSLSGLELEPLPPASNQEAIKKRQSLTNGSSIFTPRQRGATDIYSSVPFPLKAPQNEGPRNKTPNPKIILDMPDDLSENITSFLDLKDTIKFSRVSKSINLDFYNRAQEKKSDILEKIKDLCQELPNHMDDKKYCIIAKKNIVNYVYQLFFQLYCTPLRRNFTETRFQPILKEFLGAKYFEEVKKLFNFQIFEKDKLTSSESINLMFNDYRSYNNFDKMFDFETACVAFPYFLNLLLSIPNYYSPAIILDALSSAYCRASRENKDLKAFLTYFRDKKIELIRPESIDDSNKHRLREASSMPRRVQDGIKLWRQYDGSLKGLIFRIDSHCAFGKKALHFALQHADKKDKSLYSVDVGRYVRSRLKELKEFYEMKSFLLENWYDKKEVEAVKEKPYPLPRGLEAWEPEKDAHLLAQKSSELEKSFKKYDWLKKHFPRFFNSLQEPR